MSYCLFLVVFLLLPIGVMATVIVGMHRKHRLRNINLRRHFLGIAILALIAFVWTTPWDNFLIAIGVWDSPPQRILARIGYVPIEEYAFFILMPVFNGCLILFLSNHPSPHTSSPRSQQRTARIALAMLSALLMVAGFLAITTKPGTYLGLIILWFTPPLLIQWAFDPATLWREKSTVILGTAIPTLYFGLADQFAISDGIWEISSILTTGIKIAQVPIEEIIFFATTSLLLAQGLVLWHSLERRRQPS